MLSAAQPAEKDVSADRPVGVAVRKGWGECGGCAVSPALCSLQGLREPLLPVRRGTSGSELQPLRAAL